MQLLLLYCFKNNFGLIFYLRYGRRDPIEEIKDFRREQESIEKQSKNYNARNNMNAQNLMGQFQPPTDEKSRELYNIIYNSMNEEERKEQEKKYLKKVLKEEKKRKKNKNGDDEVDGINQEFRDYEKNLKKTEGMNGAGGYTKAENYLSNILKTGIGKNKNYQNDREKENRNYINMINGQKINVNHEQDSKKGKGKSGSSAFSNYFNNVVRSNLSNSMNTNFLQKKRKLPKMKDVLKQVKDNKRRKKNLGGIFSNETSLLEILFKEYGYYNIIYTMTGNNENRLGKNKIKKITNGINNLLDFDKNTTKIIKSIVNMKKLNLIDDTYLKGKSYNKNKRNSNVTSYHYHLSKDGYIYKYKIENNNNEGIIIFKCCDPMCDGKGVLNTRNKTFRITDRHNLAGYEHSYIKKGYDKFQLKMEMRNWNDLQIKNTPDEKYFCIEWHRSHV